MLSASSSSFLDGGFLFRLQLPEAAALLGVGGFDGFETRQGLCPVTGQAIEIAFLDRNLVDGLGVEDGGGTGGAGFHVHGAGDVGGGDTEIDEVALGHGQLGGEYPQLILDGDALGDRGVVFGGGVGELGCGGASAGVGGGDIFGSHLGRT